MIIICYYYNSYRNFPAKHPWVIILRNHVEIYMKKTSHMGAFIQDKKLYTKSMEAAIFTP